MKKLHYVKSLMFLVAALGLTTTFTSCDDDDDPKPVVPALTDVEGSYSGKMLALLPPPTDATGEETPAGADVTAEIKEASVAFAKFPVADLITSIVGEEIAPIIIAAVGDVNYAMKYTATFNDDKSGINLTFAPEPLVLEIELPAAEGEEPVKMKVEVAIASSEAGNFVYDNNKLAFKLQVTGVKVNEEPLDGFPATTLSFDLAKKK